MKKFAKKTLRLIARVLPRSLKNFIRNGVAELAGTREMRDTFRRMYGDYTLYEEFLKGKSDVTEYHVDKIIRSLGKQLTDLQSENAKLNRRIQILEDAIKKPIDKG